jgi:hypothetical protein
MKKKTDSGKQQKEAFEEWALTQRRLYGSHNMDGTLKYGDFSVPSPIEKLDATLEEVHRAQARGDVLDYSGHELVGCPVCPRTWARPVSQETVSRHIHEHHLPVN